MFIDPSQGQLKHGYRAFLPFTEVSSDQPKSTKEHVLFFSHLWLVGKGFLFAVILIVVGLIIAFGIMAT